MIGLVQGSNSPPSSRQLNWTPSWSDWKVKVALLALSPVHQARRPLADHGHRRGLELVHFAPGQHPLCDEHDGGYAEQEQDRHEPLEPPLQAGAPVPLLLEAELRLVLVPPRDDAAGEDVVEDLVAGVVDLALTGDGTKDACLGERSQDRLDIRLAGACVRGQVTDAVRDLRPGRRDEVVEHLRRPRLLRRLERGERAAEVVPHDLLGAAELRERGSSQHVRPLAALHLPETSKDELEVRRFHLIPIAVRIGHAPDPHLRRPHSPDANLVEHVLYELRLHGHLLRPRCELVVELERLHDRVAPGRSRQGLQPDPVLEEPGKVSLEEMEVRESVLAQRDEEVHAGPRVAGRVDEHGRDGGLDPQARLVDEQLLELVEDDEHLAVEGPSAVLDRLGQRPAGRNRRADGGRHGAADRLGELARGIASPRREEDDDVLRLPFGSLRVRGTIAQRRHHARPEERALPHAAGAVEQGHTCRPEVGRDHPPFALAAEEEGRVALGVRLQTEVGALAGRGLDDGLSSLRPAHERSSSRRSRPAT